MKNNTKQMNSKQRQKLRQREKARLLKQLGREVIAPNRPRNPRWFADVGEMKLPFGMSMGGLKMGSGSQTVGVAPKAMDPQRSTPRLKSARSTDGNVVDVITGTDLIATVSSAVAGNVAGDLLVTQLISPTQFEMSRLRQFSALYQRYRFNRIRFIYEPIANATQSGQIVGYADFDPDNEILTDSAQNVSVAVAHQGQQISQIWEPVVFDMSQLGTFTDLYTEAGSSNSDPRLSLQGIFYLIAASVLPANVPLGNIYIDYEVQFSIPFLEPEGGTLNFGTSWRGSGDYEISGSAPTAFNLQPVTSTEVDEGPYTPSFSAGMLYWDQSATGVPFTPGQQIWLTFQYVTSTPYTNGTTVFSGIDVAVSSVTPPGGASVTNEVTPVVGIYNFSAQWGGSVTCCVEISALVSNLVITFDGSGASTIYRDGTYTLSVQVTEPPLLTQKNLLKATYMKHKSRRSLREEIRQLVALGNIERSRTRELRAPKSHGHSSLTEREKSFSREGDDESSSKGKTPITRGSPVRITPPPERVELLRQRLAEAELSLDD